MCVLTIRNMNIAFLCVTGKRLFTAVYVPKDARSHIRFLIARTPYSVALMAKINIQNTLVRRLNSRRLDIYSLSGCARTMDLSKAILSR